MIYCINWTCFWRMVDFRTSYCKSSLCMHGEKIHAYGMHKLEQFCAHCGLAARAEYMVFPLAIVVSSNPINFISAHSLHQNPLLTMHMDKDKWITVHKKYYCGMPKWHSFTSSLTLIRRYFRKNRAYRSEVMQRHVIERRLKIWTFSGFVYKTYGKWLFVLKIHFGL